MSFFDRTRTFSGLACAITVFLFMVFTSPVPLMADDVPYVPTPDKVVDRMMDMAQVQSGDYVIDLGSGDGRLVIEAAKRGAIGHGVEIDPNRIAEARTNALDQGVADRVAFVQGDIFEADFSEASVVTLYLLPDVNRKLSSSLLNQLDPGTRIVSHDYGIGDWEPKEHVTIRDESLAGPHEVYYWVVPAQVEGKWTWTLNGRTFKLQVKQDYGSINAKLVDDDGTDYDLQESTVSGERLQLKATNGDTTYLMNGRVSGDNIEGSLQIHIHGTTERVADWAASRP